MKMFNRFIKFNKLTVINRKYGSIVTGANLLYEKLKHNNVNDVFMYSGETHSPLLDQFNKGNIKYFINSHKQNSGHTATGYAKSSGKTGVVITTNGAELTNMINPMLDASIDSTPLVVVSSQLKNNNKIKDVVSTDITKSITKWNYQVKNIKELPKIIDKAFFIANHGRKGVVHIDLSKYILQDTTKYVLSENMYKKNFKDMFIDYNPFTINEKEKLNLYQLDNTHNLEKCINIINKSKKPLLYIGKGCSSAIKELEKFIKTTNIPVTTTMHAKGIFDENEDISLNWCGECGSPAANFAIQESDCIISIGNRLDDKINEYPFKYADVAKNNFGIINVNIDSSEFNNTNEYIINVQLTSNNFIRYLNSKIDYNKLNNDWNLRIQHLKYINYFKYNEPKDNKLNYEMVIDSVNTYCNHLPSNKAVITTGTGDHQTMAYQLINGNYPNKILSPGSSNIMNTGLAYSIGSQIANPDKLVINLDSNSNFMMNVSDIKSVIDHKLPIKIAIMNSKNNFSTSENDKTYFVNKQNSKDKKFSPSFSDLAKSFGFQIFKCDNSTNLQEVTNNFLNSNGYALCEYTVE